jgi:hypothetical protein
MLFELRKLMPYLFIPFKCALSLVHVLGSRQAHQKCRIVASKHCIRSHTFFVECVSRLVWNIHTIASFNACKVSSMALISSFDEVVLDWHRRQG